MSGFLNQSLTVETLDLPLFTVALKTLKKDDDSSWTELETKYLYNRLDQNNNKRIELSELSLFDDSCLPCPKHGAVCNNEGTKIPDMDVGFWRNNPQHPDLGYMRFYKCFRVDACPGGNGSIPCTEGYDAKSPACSYCAPDYVLMENKCDYCPGKANMGSAAPAQVAFLAFIVIGVYLAYLQLTQPSLSKEDIKLIQTSFKKRR